MDLEKCVAESLLQRKKASTTMKNFHHTKRIGIPDVSVRITTGAPPW